MLAMLLAASLSLSDWGLHDWKQLTRGELSIRGGQLRVLSLRVGPGSAKDLPPPAEPHPVPVRSDLVRGLWVWTPDAALPAFVAREHINRVFLQVPRRPWGPDLESMVERVSQAGATVYALDGDPRDALPENHSEVLATVNAVAEFNLHARVPFAGVHLDVEPYLLPGFGGTRRDAILNDYLALVQAVRTVCDNFKLKLELDIPPWYDAPDELTGELPRPVTHRIIDLADAVVLMDYRTNPHRALQEAVPHVRYATQAHRQVLVGFETMALPDEELYFFRGPALDRPKAGGYWVGAEKDQLRLLAPDDSRDGQAAECWWAVTHHLTLTGDSQSFAHLGLARLNQSLDYLGQRLSAEPGFAGFALHHYGSYGQLMSHA